MKNLPRTDTKKHEKEEEEFTTEFYGVYTEFHGEDRKNFI